jgi:hypothetical protein
MAWHKVGAFHNTFIFSPPCSGVQSKFRAAGKSCRSFQGICDASGKCQSPTDANLESVVGQLGWIIEYWLESVCITLALIPSGTFCTASRWA